MCRRRYTTYERVEDRIRLTVIKRDGSRMPYDRLKILESIRSATFKRKVPRERIERAVDEVEEHLAAAFEKEVSSHTIGERVAETLRKVDKVAYVRFASVYRRSEDVDEFIDEAQEVIERESRDVPGQRTLFDETER